MTSNEGRNGEVGWAYRPALLLPLLAAITFLAYTSSLRGELQFDDNASVLENVGIRDLGGFLRGPFLAAWAEAGRPVTELTFALDFAWGGLDVLPFHATNVLLHLAAVALVWLLTRRTLRRVGWPEPDGLSAWVAALFALHPIQSQAVSYVSQRAEVLASLFSLGALWLLLDAEERPRTGRGRLAYAAALASFALGLGSKAVAVTLPVAFLLHAAAFPLRGGAPTTPALAPARPGLRRLLWISPFLLLGAAFAVLQVGALSAERGAGFELPGLGPLRYALTQPRVILTYLRLLVWPAGLNVDHELRPSDGLLEPGTLAAALALGALAAGAAWGWIRSRRATTPPPEARALRLASFGFAWFLLLLSPTSSVVPLQDVIEEHRVYLAGWGILLALAAGASVLFTRLAGEDARSRRLGLALAGLTLLALGGACWERNRVWDSRVSLWRDVVAKSPTKARGHENLGHALYLAGDWQGAMAEYWTALRLGGDGSVPMAKLLNNVAASYMELDRLTEAAAFLENALTIAPDDVRLLNNLAMTRLWQGQLDAALATAQRSVRLHPDDPGARNALGQVLAKRGRPAEAARQFAAEAELNPDVAPRLRGSALERERAGDARGACAAWLQLLSMRPGAELEQEARGRVAALGCRR